MFAIFVANVPAHLFQLSAISKLFVVSAPKNEKETSLSRVQPDPDSSSMALRQARKRKERKKFAEDPAENDDEQSSDDQK